MLLFRLICFYSQVKHFEITSCFQKYYINKFYLLLLLVVMLNLCCLYTVCTYILFWNVMQADSLQQKNHLHTCLQGPEVPPTLASLWSPEETHSKHKKTLKKKLLCRRISQRSWLLFAASPFLLGVLVSLEAPSSPLAPDMSTTRNQSKLRRCRKCLSYQPVRFTCHDLHDNSNIKNKDAADLAG